MAIAYECPECRTRWPHYRPFASCPECLVPCRAAVTARALTSGEARSRLRRIEFLRYYEAREADRDGPTPEEVGAREGREEAARIRELNKTLNEETPGH